MAACGKFTFSSTAGPALDARLWRPEGSPRAVVQLVHGMAEHIDRYDPVARRLNRAGLAVVGHTHLGHGPRAQRQGYFADHDGWQHLIDDVHRLRGIAQEQFPGLPYLLLGHSMGSFVTRCYLQEHGEGLTGALLSGTGHFDGKTVTAALAAANLVCLLGGRKKPSPLIDHLAFGGYSKPFAPNRTDFDWLSRAEAEVDQYVADPYCGFLFTGSGYRELFRGLKRLTDPDALKRMPRQLPVLLISGDSDPVGGMGRGVEQVAREMRDAGMKHVEVRLYPGARHEILNETNRDEVVRDVIIFVEQCLNGQG
ncbi:MAG: alpha/beta fold hydrolase [Aristaeellaceae bacterium]